MSFLPASPTPPPTDIADALSAAGSRLGAFGERLVWYAQVPSTNDVAAAMAARGAAEGVVVAADAQTAGRGRAGRVWASPPGAGLYVSLVLRPEPAVAPLVTVTAGVAVADAVLAGGGLPTRLKWPNDVCVGPRKLAGILAEGGSSGARVQHVVLGIGVNVRPAAYPPDVAARATSIEGEVGGACDRGRILAEVLAAWAAWYRRLQQGDVAAILAAWRAAAASSLGRAVEWDAGGRLRTGIAEDIDDDGALLVREGRDLIRVISGEVRWLT